MTSTNYEILAVATPQIKAEESCRLTAYLDTLGVPTIGWGRADDGVKMGDTCTQTEADAWLQAKLGTVLAQLDSALPWWRQLNPVRCAVMVSWVYQLGMRGVLRFPKALAAIKASEWDTAYDAMMDSLWATVQTPARAEREAKQMQTGVVEPDVDLPT